jgi:hypothetical protein
MAAVASTAPCETQGRRAFDTGENRAQDTRGDKILKEIKKLRDTYGQQRARDSQAIPYQKIAAFLQEVEALAREKRGDDASRRVENIATRMEAAIEKIEKESHKKTSPVTYAQAARGGDLGQTQGILRGVTEPPKASPRDGKRLVIKIQDKDAADEVKNMTTETLMEKIRGDAGAAQARKTVVAIQRLKSGDIAIYTEGVRERAQLENDEEWVKDINPKARVVKRTWPVIVHGMRVADFQQDAGEAGARRIEEENAKRMPGLKIASTRWLTRRENLKDYSSMIIEVASAEQANRMILEGVVYRMCLKTTEAFQPKGRIVQCFNCQKYGHTSRICSAAQKCGHCGGEHRTDECARDPQTGSRRCAACSGGDHTSWSTHCPARLAEVQRARRARALGPKLFPIATPERIFPGLMSTSSTGVTPMSSQQSTSEDGSWEIADGRKRKKPCAGRPIGAVNKPKNLRQEGDQMIRDLFDTERSRREGTSEMHTTSMQNTHAEKESVLLTQGC